MTVFVAWLFLRSFVLTSARLSALELRAVHNSSAAGAPRAGATLRKQETLMRGRKLKCTRLFKYNESCHLVAEVL